MDDKQSDDEIARRVALRDDFEYYAPNCLRIRPKEAKTGLMPLMLNTAQRYLHEKAEDQIAKLGRVRILVLKGRQQGCSTYIGGRFYHKTTHSTGVKAYILTHEMDATENLFGMTERFHDNCPPLVRPQASADNAKELVFGKLDSSYGIGTAGAKATGRSQTIQLFHGSEVAFWKNPDDHMAGVLQAVPDADGTEIWLESTANGVGNWFYKECMSALKGKSAFEFVFIPWFWQQEYRLPIPPNFRVTPEEDKLIDLFGLDGQQLTWRRNKIATLKEKFKQEYPNTPEEAFETTGEDVLIGSALIRSAAKRDVAPIPGRPIVWGVDPARFGDDRKTLAKRHGNVLLEPIKVLLPNMPAGPQSDTRALAGAVAREFREAGEKQPHYICVDSIGVGAGVADNLRGAKLKRFDGIEVEVIDVNVAEGVPDDERFLNLRDQLWWAMKEWFNDRGCKMPEDDDLVSELAAVKFTYTSAGRIEVESKKEMKKRLGFSPDKADALMITFHAPNVVPEKPMMSVGFGGRGDTKAGY